MANYYLDREITFRKWVELGTLTNVGCWWAEQGVISRTGRNYSNAALSYAARRWVVMNAQEARQYYNQYGWYPDDISWNKWLVRTALKVFHSHKREVLAEFLDRNGLRDTYGYIIGEGQKP
jgi:hypothetical protein